MAANLLDKFLAGIGLGDIDPALLTEEEEAEFLPEGPEPTGHYENLAEYLEPKVLDRLAADVIDWVDWDEESRVEWEQRESRGIRFLGVSSKTEGGANFPGASRVVHPLLMEAITQFNSRALGEMWPASGPVKTDVLGEVTPETTEQAERVQAYMNYLYTKQMPGAFENEDQLLFRLPLSGSCFKKVYWNVLLKTICADFVEPADFIVPYSAADLMTAPRFTHRIREHHNDVLKKIQSGFYLDQEMEILNNESADYPQVREEIELTEGRERASIVNENRHTILECYADLDLDGFNDLDESGRETGIALPYIITVDRESQKILRVQRNWDEQDQDNQKRIYFSHYKFTPGFGFYGYGLLHLIGGLSESATESLRKLLDAADFSNMQGGYKSRDAKITGGDTPIGPGEWRETDSSAEELSKAFFQLPYREPSQTLFNLLGYLDERAQRFIGTTENMVGEAKNTAPVGTTLALIEQGSKVFSAIHKRLHEAHQREFKIVAELCRDHLSEEGYPYLIAGQSQLIMRADFDDRIDVVPVSDPNIISQTQRIVQAQILLDLSDKYPDIINRRQSVENMLEAARIAGHEKFMIDENAQSALQQEQQMQIQKLQAEINKVNADIEKIVAQRTTEFLKAQYTAYQAALVAVQTPAVAPVADALFKAAGGIDMAATPAPQVPQEQQILYPEEAQAPAPAGSPAKGFQQGIETPEADGNSAPFAR